MSAAAPVVAAEKLALHFGSHCTPYVIMLGANVDHQWMALIVARDEISFFL